MENLTFNNDIQLIAYSNRKSLDYVYFLLPPVFIALSLITSFRSWLKLNLVFSNVFGLLMIVNPEILISEIVHLIYQAFIFFLVTKTLFLKVKQRFRLLNSICF